MPSLHEIIRSNRSGARAGIWSICSSNRFVLETAMIEAAKSSGIVCIESTSNQVNQFGGYSGMTAAEFAEYLREIASGAELPHDRILLGGDHLGPHPWQGEPARTAMEKACALVRSCVLAGYTKIHLDASMRCADDPGDADTPLEEARVTSRAAELCRAAEEARAMLPRSAPSPVYVIGTDVPPPGGEQHETRIWTTGVADLDRTVSITREAFFSAGLEDAWNRVIAVVVQPGVEFGDTSVFEYDREKARPLSQRIREMESLVFEAHSTDYQTRTALRHMVEDHYAVLKVGPWLTFVFREAVFSLEAMEQEWLGRRGSVRLSGVRQALENAMLADPRHWNKFYHGDEGYLQFARKYSFSDRSRYYWPQPEVQDSLRRLIANLSDNRIPLALLSQFMPRQYEAVRANRLSTTPVELIRDSIAEVLDCYAEACGAF